MSIPQIVEQLRSLEETSIRGHLSIEDLVRRQIDRCNVSMGGADETVFEANVRALMKMLPAEKLRELLDNSSSYNYTTDEWVYEYWCGVKMGTPDNPITDEEGNVLSPTEVTNTVTDYEKLYEMVIQGFESLGLTWRVDSRVVVVEKVIRGEIPEGVINKAEQAVINVLMDTRADMIMKAKKLKSRAERRKVIVRANEMGFNSLVEQLRDRVPPTPVFEVA